MNANVEVKRVYIRAGEDGYIPTTDDPERFCGTFGVPRIQMPVCTREYGHDGPHVAHGSVNQMLAVWEAAHVDS